MTLSAARSRAANSPEPNGRATPTRPRPGVATGAPAAPATILAQRAAALALAPVQAETVATLDALEFQIAGETYGIAIPYIGEIYPLRELTPLPGTPAFVRGITSVRGQIFSVIDLHRFLGLGEGDGPDQGAAAPAALRPAQALNGAKGRPAGTPAIILEVGEMRVAVLADRIVGVRALPVAAIQPVPPTLIDAHSAYLYGVTSDRLLILDAEKLLTDSALIVNDELDY